MEYKKKIRWLIVIAALAFGVSTILYYIGRQFDDIGSFIDVFSVISFVLLLILYFLPAQIFTSWFKFARIYIPIALVLALGGGATSNGSDLFNTDSEFFTTFFSVIFVIVSLILIIRKAVLLRRAKTVSSPTADS